jgi:DedD protein
VARRRLILAAWIPIVDVQAKDRLTGAVILVALLVLFVPELLSGPGRKAATIATQPTDEPPLRSYTVELGDESRGRHALVPGPAPAAPPPVAATVPAATVPAATAPAVTVPAVTAPAATTPEPTTPEATTPAATAPRRQEPVRATAAPANPVARESVPPSLAGWTVQLGSFASRANAERLVRDLKARGYAAFLTESASGGRKLYRVRVGPAGNRASAQTLAAQLRSAGHPGSLTQRP